MISRARAPLIVWLTLALLCGAYVASETRVNTDLSQFLPRHSEGEHEILLDELAQGRAARLLLLAIEGDSQAGRARLSERLAASLTEEPAIGQVLNSNTSLDEQSQSLLFRHRYLLSETAFDSQSLRLNLEARLEELASPIAPLEREKLPADPTATYLDVLEQVRPGAQPRQSDGVWVSPDGARALLLVELAEQGLDVQAQARVLERIEARYQALAPDAQLVISGPAQFAAQASATIRQETQLLTALGSGLLMLILLLVYRSPRVLILAGLPLASAMLAATAAVTWAFGSVHGISLAFGITVLGVAIDYPLHYFSHLRGNSAETALRTIWPTLRLGVATTLVGYLSLTLTDFTGLAQLGVFAAVGLLTAALTTRWVLPALSGPAIRAQATLGQWPSRLNRLAPPRWIAAAAAGLIVLAFALLLLGEQPLWERDLAALSPVSDAERALDRELRLQLGAAEPGQLILVRGSDAEQVLRRSEALLPQLERLRSEGLLEHFDSAAAWLPSRRTQLQRRQQLPEQEELAAALSQAQDGLPFRSDAFQPFLDDVAASHERTPLTPALLSDSLLGQRLQGQLYERERGWLALIPLIGVHAPEQLAQQFEHAASGVHYLDLSAASASLMDSFRDEALQRLSWGALAIVLMLALGLKSLKAALSVAAPVALAALGTVAVLLASGQALSLFHLIALLLVMGIGLDYSLFFRLRRHRREDAPATLHALLVCALSSFSVFILLASSQIPVLKALGLTVAVGVLFSFVFALLISAASTPAPRRP